MSERASWTIFVSGIAVLILLGLSTALLTSRYATSEDLVAHTHRVETAVARVRGDLRSAESASLSFIATGDRAYLEQYEKANADLSARVVTLSELTADNPTQQKSLAEFNPLISESRSLMDRAIALAPNTPTGDQADLIRQWRDTTSKAVNVLASMRDEENRLMTVRVITSTTTYRNTLRLLVIVGAAVLLFLAIVFRLLLKGLSERKQAESAVRRLSIRILQLRDDERRKIARDLHDSIGQSMAAVAMNLTMLREHTLQIPSDKRDMMLSDSLELVQQTVMETRTISHLLHPPLLDEAGFVSAAKWYVDGFTKRSQITVNLDISADVGRLPRETELVLFRALQEGLTNIHKHSGSTQVTVQLTAQPHGTVFIIRDNGKGIPPSTLAEFQRTGGGSGIGLAGIRERVQDLGGRFELKSSGEGTQLAVMLPTKPLDSSTLAPGGANFESGTPSLPTAKPLSPLNKSGFSARTA